MNKSSFLHLWEWLDWLKTYLIAIGRKRAIYCAIDVTKFDQDIL